ncbi:hypothetical protein NE547_08810 [Flavonifractor sp. DFI.6.63]|uniref:hypothetical protein n=1 Tax=Flavonifractor sp. DFI.6.63 TaxID=2963704 RepID=UPI00210B7546|nr:hypothetical protein [Flavonifractor sp. DFI.6.63]MCQ5029636.1 hypothetical protein [Flavonifractor sp. DFI.6.63]
MKRTAAPPPSEETVMSYANVPVEVAAPFVGWSTTTLYAALQQGRAPFGFAVENEAKGSWAYNISPGGLIRYKRDGCPMIRLGELREFMADSAKEVLDAKVSTLGKIVEAVMQA